MKSVSWRIDSTKNWRLQLSCRDKWRGYQESPQWGRSARSSQVILGENAIGKPITHHIASAMLQANPFLQKTALLRSDLHTKHQGVLARCSQSVLSLWCCLHLNFIAQTYEREINGALYQTANRKIAYVLAAWLDAYSLGLQPKIHHASRLQPIPLNGQWPWAVN